MKKMVAVMIWVLVIDSHSFASDHPPHKVRPNEHIYIDGAKVRTSNKGIYINIGDEIISVRSIHSDKNGLFISENQLKNSPEFVSKRIHRCVCHWCGKIFVASHWRKYCSPKCEYASYGEE